jgi:Fic family protein
VSDDALLCSTDQKAEIEAANGVAQIDYLTDLVTSYRAHDLRESHVLQLQAIAVTGIYPCAGTYRDARSKVYISGSEHVPPEAALVPAMVRDMIDWINQARSDGRSALDRAAYALWRLNWIHPFRGGNGRTSRAIAYLIICMDMGQMIPGIPTLPSLIYVNRDAYVEALRDADRSLREAVVPDSEVAEPELSTMNIYLRELVMRQMASAIQSLAAGRP